MFHTTNISQHYNMNQQMWLISHYLSDNILYCVILNVGGGVEINQSYRRKKLFREGGIKNVKKG